jgi:hypothetical protein
VSNLLGFPLFLILKENEGLGKRGSQGRIKFSGFGFQAIIREVGF